MKKTDLEKLKAKKITGRLAQSGTPARFGASAAPPAIDRRAQRKLDQAAGLVPFATKLPAALILQLQRIAEAAGESPGDVLARLLADAQPGWPGYHESTVSQEG